MSTLDNPVIKENTENQNNKTEINEYSKNDIQKIQNIKENIKNAEANDPDNYYANKSKNDLQYMKDLSNAQQINTVREEKPNFEGTELAYRKEPTLKDAAENIKATWKKMFG